jgi:uncharacterized membrane protein
MKSLCVSLFTTSVLALAVGCEGPHSPPPGGPGATESADHKVQFGVPDNAFKLDMPTLSTHVKQGERKDVKIGIKRGKNFDQDVKLELSSVPQGVTIKPMNPTVKAGEKEVNVQVDASKDAALGDHDVQVKATPAKEGSATTDHFKITVEKP